LIVTVGGSKPKFFTTTFTSPPCCGGAAASSGVALDAGGVLEDAGAGDGAGESLLLHAAIEPTTARAETEKRTFIVGTSAHERASFAPARNCRRAYRSHRSGVCPDYM